MNEAIALVHSVPGWTVCGTAEATARRKEFSSKTKFIWKSGKVAQLKSLINDVRTAHGVDAVLVNEHHLSSAMHENLRREFGVPVIDRQRLYGWWSEDQCGRAPDGAAGEKHKQILVLIEREKYLRKKLRDAQEKNESSLEHARHHNVQPLIAIIGYTNSGKTSLIQALTHDSRAQPRSQLFATLDVQSFHGILPNKLPVVFADTVGFIDNLPTALLPTFHATLQAVQHATQLIHIVDASDPSFRLQHETVIRSLQSLNLRSALLDGIINVYNKCDLLDGDAERANEIKTITSDQSTNNVAVSCKTGDGMQQLIERLQISTMKSSGHFTRVLRIRANDSEKYLTYLHRHVTVTNVCIDENNDEFLRVSVVFNDITAAQFDSHFKIKQKKG